MSKASEWHNKQPHEVRKWISLGSAETQINQIRIDQNKAKAAYQKYMGETNDHIASLKRSMLRIEKELEEK